MAKQKSSSTAKPGVKCPEGGCLKDLKLLKVNPKKQQFEPTPAEPYRQHFKMAGGC
jgi:hypothetical protein